MVGSQEEARRDTDLRGPVLVGLGVFVIGFVVLCLIWSLGSWPSSVPGLFDYRSPFLGYGLLAPVAIALLVAGRQRLIKAAGHNSWRPLVFGAAIGLGAAAAVQVGWLLDGSPEPNWSFPRAHHFNLGGIWNAFASVLICAVLAALISDTATLARRLRRQGDDLKDEISEAGLGGVVFCLVGLAGLIALDSGRADQTDAGLTTVIALALAAVAAVAVFCFAFAGQIRRFVSALIWGLAGAAGLVALCGNGIEARSEIGAAIVATALLSGFAVSQPFSAGTRIRWIPAAAAMLVIAGAGGWAVTLVEDQGAAAAAVVAGGSALAVLVGGYGSRFDLAAFLRGCAIAFCLGTLAWAAWIELKNDPDKAEHAYNAVAVLFEILVLILIRDRIKELVRGEEAAASGAEDVDTPPGWAAWIQFVGFGLPGVLATLVFLIVAGPLLGANDVAQGSGATVAGVAIFGGAGVLVALAGALLARSRHAPLRQPDMIDVDLPVPWPAAALAAAGAGVVVIVFVAGLAWEQLRLEGLAAVLALIYGALCLEDLRATPARLQLMELGARGWLVAASAAIAQTAALFWLISVGIWHDGASAEVASMIGNALLVLLIGYLIHVAAGLVLAWSLPGQALTPEPADVNIAGIGALYFGLALLGAVVPAFVADRVAAAQSLADSGTFVLGSVFVVPSCCAAVYWILKENFAHVERQRKNPPPPALVALFPNDPSAAEEAKTVRVERQASHADWQFRLSIALVSIGLGYAVAVSL